MAVAGGAATGTGGGGRGRLQGRGWIDSFATESTASAAEPMRSSRSLHNAASIGMRGWRKVPILDQKLLSQYS